MKCNYFTLAVYCYGSSLRLVLFIYVSLLHLIYLGLQLLSGLTTEQELSVGPLTQGIATLRAEAC